MSAPESLAAALARAAADRKTFEGIPVPSALQILEEAWDRILFTPEAAQVEAAGIGGIESAFALIVPALCPADAPFVGLEVKGLDFFFHLGIALMNARARRAEAARQAQAKALESADPAP